MKARTWGHPEPLLHSALPAPSLGQEHLEPWVFLLRFPCLFTDILNSAVWPAYCGLCRYLRVKTNHNGPGLLIQSIKDSKLQAEAPSCSAPPAQLHLCLLSPQLSC